MTQTYYTTAPKDYDYGWRWTKEIRVVGTYDGKPMREVQIEEGHESYQIGRYNSGMHPAFTVAEWEKHARAPWFVPAPELEVESARLDSSYDMTDSLLCAIFSAQEARDKEFEEALWDLVAPMRKVARLMGIEKQFVKNVQALVKEETELVEEVTVSVEAPPCSYKVGCKQKGDREWSYNSLRFAAKEDAERYGSDLFSRWTGLGKYEVHPSDEAPNR